MSRSHLIKSAITFLCASLACLAMLLGCAPEEPAEEDLAGKLRDSLQTALSTFDESSEGSIDALVAPIDTESLDSLGLSSKDVAEKVMADLEVNVGEVNMEDDIAVAEVYVKCKDIPAVSEAINELSKDYASSPKATNQLVSQLAQKAENLIDQVPTKEFGPIYLEYYRSGAGWVLSDESRERLSAELSKGSTQAQ